MKVRNLNDMLVLSVLLLMMTVVVMRAWDVAVIVMTRLNNKYSYSTLACSLLFLITIYSFVRDDEIYSCGLALYLS